MVVCADKKPRSQDAKCGTKIRVRIVRTSPQRTGYFEYRSRVSPGQLVPIPCPTGETMWLELRLE